MGWVYALRIIAGVHYKDVPVQHLARRKHVRKSVGLLGLDAMDESVKHAIPIAVTASVPKPTSIRLGDAFPKPILGR
jgi:hypothetical protein